VMIVFMRVEDPGGEPRHQRTWVMIVFMRVDNAGGRPRCRIRMMTVFMRVEDPGGGPRRRTWVMIVFMRVEDAAALLSATRRLNETGRFVWIASDGWGKEELPVLGKNEVAAEGALTIELQTTPLPEFDTYFGQLRPSTNHRNPWFREYWERAHDCTFDVNTSVDERRRNSTVLTYAVCNIAVDLYSCPTPRQLPLTEHCRPR